VVIESLRVAGIPPWLDVAGLEVSLFGETSDSALRLNVLQRPAKSTLAPARLHKLLLLRG
jgi:hypothetical protein